MSLRTSPIAPYYYRLLENWLLPVLKRTHTNPNRLTLAGLALAAAVPVGFYFHPAIGFVLMGLSGVADSLDGAVAKNQVQRLQVRRFFRFHFRPCVRLFLPVRFLDSILGQPMVPGGQRVDICKHAADGDDQLR